MFSKESLMATNQPVMKSEELQKNFFERIKRKLPPHVAMVDTVSELLGISSDSAYRRIRGEKQLDFEEVSILSNAFNVSLDELIHIKKETFLFSGRITANDDFTYQNWLELCVYHLERIKAYNPNHLYYLAKEVPFYYYFLIPEVAAFKSFFFMKFFLHYEEWREEKFTLDDDYGEYLKLTTKISRLFGEIPSTEIWSIENITSTLHQIEYCRATGYMPSDSDTLTLFDKIDEMINHIERQAECGYKLQSGVAECTTGPGFRMFINDITMGDNMQLIKLGDTQLTYINHSIINFITTFDVDFNTYTKQAFEAIAHKSTPITIENQRDRLVFFNRLKAKVDLYRQQVLHGKHYLDRR